MSALCSAPLSTTPLSSFHPPDRGLRLRALLSSSDGPLPGADHGPGLRAGIRFVCDDRAARCAVACVLVSFQRGWFTL